ncbi:MAG: MBL fold metallo-hydrolase [Bdellovibrionales bacterium]|jgi:phosphoribosyl 1,2-cyclic phosphate phosphodiesterase
MKITILGCGGSGGVPLIGNEWGACDPKEPRNKRTCVSILVEEGDQTLLVDTSPDMREQLLQANVRDITAILYTHAHADHCHGIDNIRSLNWLTQRPVPIYADAATMADLEHRFEYIFVTRPHADRFTRPNVETHILDGHAFTLGSIKVTSFPQEHGAMISMGYRFGDFAYSTDAGALDEAAFEALRGVKVWVLGAIRHEPHPAHAHVERALEWIARVKPERAYLTHMNQTLDYATLKASLPAHIEPAYDGLVIKL